MYDAVIVGARCAGSPLAMLLAQKGYRVAAVDRDGFPSDTMSTHYLQPWGLAYLQQWGLLDDVLRATTAPKMPSIRIGFGGPAMALPTRDESGVEFALCPRRTVLDNILVQAARAAGAEVHEHFVMQDVLFERHGDQRRVCGVRGRDQAGTTIELGARFVIGADGQHSNVAKVVAAPEYNDVPGATCGYYAYFSGLPLETAEIYYNQGNALLLFPTDDELTCVASEWPAARFKEVRPDVTAALTAAADLNGEVGARFRAARQEERYQGAAVLPNFFRKPWGPGWGLVGDAGYYKDPITGLGISDAWRDAALLADALDATLSGRAPEAEAMAGYEQQRNAAAMPHYQRTLFLAQLHPGQVVAQAMAGARAGAT